MPHAGFVVDAGLEVGGGHLARCQTLASTLAMRGWTCLLLAPQGADAVRMTPLATGVGLDELAGIALADPSAVRHVLGRSCDCLVIDHYDLGASFESAFAGFASVRLVIEDRPGRRHRVEALLDQTAGRTGAEYRDMVSPGTRLLLGSHYALVRPQFAAAHKRLREARTAREFRPLRLFLSVGAADTLGVTETVLDALAKLDLGLEISVVLGHSSPNLDPVARRVRARPGSELHVSPSVDDMIALMEADLGIGGAGTSAWERCAVGLPSIALVVADNQFDNATALAAAGAAHVIDFRDADAPRKIAAATAELLADTTARIRMGEAARQLCDGAGARRVADEIEALVAANRESKP